MPRVLPALGRGFGSVVSRDERTAHIRGAAAMAGFVGEAGRGMEDGVCLTVLGVALVFTLALGRNVVSEGEVVSDLRGEEGRDSV